MDTQRLRIAITGGGSGGHLSPAVAIIESVRTRLPANDLELLYIGSRTGAEARVIPVMGIRYKAVSSGKLRRYLSLSNLIDILRVPLGILQCCFHLLQFRPRALLATGGYVSVPAVVAAWMLRRPILVHEQTGALGLANRINARFASLIALSVPGSEQGLGKRRWALTGNPVRGVVRSGTKLGAARRFGLDPDTPTIYVTGGAQGSHIINETVAGTLSDLLKLAQVIHQCGDSEGTHADYEALLQRATDGLPARLKNRYVLLRYIGQEIGDVYAISDLVVGRAGAGTVNEIATLGKPSILIPLPHAAGDEQRHNARRLEAAGAAVVIEERELSPGRLYAGVSVLLSDPEKLKTMSQASGSSGFGDAAGRIASLLINMARGEQEPLEDVEATGR